MERQCFAIVQAPIRKAEGVGRNLLERIIVVPLDQRRELAIFFENVERVVVPSILADQAAEAIQGGRRLGDGDSRLMLLARENTVALRHDLHPVTELVVENQCAIALSNFDLITAAIGQLEKLPAALDKIDSIRAFAIPAIQP